MRKAVRNEEAMCTSTLQLFLLLLFSPQLYFRLQWVLARYRRLMHSLIKFFPRQQTHRYTRNELKTSESLRLTFK